MVQLHREQRAGRSGREDRTPQCPAILKKIHLKIRHPGYLPGCHWMQTRYEHNDEHFCGRWSLHQRFSSPLLGWLLGKSLGGPTRGKPQAARGTSSRFAATFPSYSRLTTSTQHPAKLRPTGEASDAAYGRPG